MQQALPFTISSIPTPENTLAKVKTIVRVKAAVVPETTDVRVRIPAKARAGARLPTAAVKARMGVKPTRAPER
jgi:hypothetical protein